MTLRPIPFEKLLVQAHHLWNQQYLLLSCGDFEKNDFNSMTVGWGSLGTMWGKPFAQVVVRPHRYTFTFLERYDSFTLCAFPDQYRGALSLLGTKSGRQGNKIKESGLTAVPSSQVASPVFSEAELMLECKKVYWQDMDPAHFLDPGINSKYPARDYHRIYFGEIVAVYGTDKFYKD